MNWITKEEIDDNIRNIVDLIIREQKTTNFEEFDKHSQGVIDGINMLRNRCFPN